MVNKKKIKTKTKSVRESKGVSLEEYNEMEENKDCWKEKYYNADSRSDDYFSWAAIVTGILVMMLVMGVGLFWVGDIDAVNVDSFGQAICQENGQEYSHRDYVRKDVDGDAVRGFVSKVA